MSDLDRVVAAVAASKKYRSICVETIRRIAEGEMTNQDDIKTAVKATKRRLHQIYGAFEGTLDYGAAYERLQLAYETGLETEVKAACRDVLSLHSSTRERLPFLDCFYSQIFQITGRPASLLDLGCGLNPVALPWMDLPPQARYTPIDIDAQRIDFLNRYLALAGRPPLARCQDLLLQPPPEADIALLLKMSPSLERQETGATLRLLDQVSAPLVVLSYAIKSLGGREKGMLAHYERQFRDLARNRDWSVQQIAFETELVFVVQRRA